MVQGPHVGFPAQPYLQTRLSTAHGAPSQTMLPRHELSPKLSLLSYCVSPPPPGRTTSQGNPLLRLAHGVPLEAEVPPQADSQKTAAACLW